MSKNIEDEARLNHILDAANLVLEFATNLDPKDFVTNNQNKLLISGCLYQLMIIGEASKHISDELKIKYPKIEWKLAYKTRNILVHEYHNVQMSIIYKIANKSLPEFKNGVELILKEIEDKKSN